MRKQPPHSIEPQDLGLSATQDITPALRPPGMVEVPAAKGSQPVRPPGMVEVPAVKGSQPVRPRLHSAELLGTAREIVIEHAGEEYRLRLTRQGKLILTK